MRSTTTLKYSVPINICLPGQNHQIPGSMTNPCSVVPLYAVHRWLTVSSCGTKVWIKAEKKKKGTWDREQTKNKFCSAHKGGGVRAVSCAFMMIFHLEQTSWASQREESIDLPGSNHNTSTFPQVYFLAFYQDFINYFGWQIDLLPPPLLREGRLDCEQSMCMCVCLLM